MMSGSSFDNDYNESLPKYKIIVLGKTGTGKTKLLTRYQHGIYDDSGMSSTAVDYNLIKRKHAVYCYYDTAGQQAYRSIVDHYYKGSDVCLICYDSSDLKSFEEIPFYYNKVKELTQQSIIYLVGCKSDIPSVISMEDVAKKYKGIKHVSTSAKANTNVTETFKEIEDQIYRLRPLNNIKQGSKIKKISYPQRKNQSTSKKPCC